MSDADRLFNRLKRPPKHEIHLEFASRLWEFYHDVELFHKWLRNLGWDDPSEFFIEMKTYADGSLRYENIQGLL